MMEDQNIRAQGYIRNGVSRPVEMKAGAVTALMGTDGSNRSFHRGGWRADHGMYPPLYRYYYRTRNGVSRRHGGTKHSNEKKERNLELWFPSVQSSVFVNNS